MAQIKVSALTALTATDGNEELLINDGGTSKKVTIDNVLHDNSIRAEHYVDGSIATAHIADNAITSAKLGVDVIVAEDVAANAITIAELAGESVDESKLKVSNAPSNGYFLSAQSGNTGGLTWAAVSDTIETNLTATSNIGLGANAVDSITTGDYNVGLGDNAGTAITSGANNTAIGYNSLQS